MKKIITIILTLMLGLTAVFGLCACNNDKNEKLVLGFDAEFPPYGYLDTTTNEYTGFDIELAKKVCKNLNYELELKPINWDFKDSLLDSGAIDFIWNGFTYEGREDDYTWSDKYISSSIVVLTKNTKGINSLDDLAGKKVVVQKESSGETAINEPSMETLKNSFLSLSTEGDYNMAYTKLSGGAYDAIIIDYGVAKQYQSVDNSLIILDEVITSENYAIGFKKGNTTLCKKINDELIKVSKDTNFIKGLCEKYEIDYNSYLLGK